MISSRSRVGPPEAKSLAKDAYLFGLPPVYLGLTIDVATNVAKPVGLRAPINQFAHVRRFPDADTLDSLAHLDLSFEPIVLSIPDMGSRWWIMQLVDLWNDVPAALDARTHGGRGGNFAISGPNWRGTVPDGLIELRSDTNLAVLVGRAHTNQYKLTPLSKWGTDYVPPSGVTTRPGIDDKTPIPAQVFSLSPEEFFSRLCRLLVDNPPRAADTPILSRIARLGIIPGGELRLNDFVPEVQNAISEGVSAAQQHIRDGRAAMGEMVNGRRIARELGRCGTRYDDRATWTYFGAGANLVEDAAC